MASDSTSATLPAAVTSRPTQSFASSFWTQGYLPGLTVLFNKLDQGVAENKQVIELVASRISHESAFASHLKTSSKDIANSRTAQLGFNRDEGASLKQTFQSYLDESSTQGEEHGRIAASLERTVRGPFSQYALSHKNRVSHAHSTLVGLTEDYHKASANVTKAQQAYFAKACQLEDFSDPTISSAVPRIITSPSGSSPMSSISLTLSMPDSMEPAVLASIPPRKIGVAASPPQPMVSPNIVMGHLSYTPAQFLPLLQSMLATIPQQTLKLSIIGSYDHASTGDDVVKYIRKYLVVKSLGAAEKIGQSLIDNGFLRLVGAVGSKFSGSETSYYQWQAKAFNFDPELYLKQADLPADNSAPGSAKSEGPRTPTTPITPNTPRAVPSRVSALSKLSKVGGYFSGLLNEDEEKNDGQSSRDTQMSKLQREIAEADQRYKDLVSSLDMQRIQLEQKMFEILSFMQQCERDRMAAVKRVLQDFASAISSSADGLKASTSRMLMYQEFVDPLKDLNYLIERYKTGTYAPTPIVYDNFFNSTKIQSFGVDIKHSAFIIPIFLDYFAHSNAPEKSAAADVDDTDNVSEKSNVSIASDKTADFPSSKPKLSVATSAAAIANAKRVKYRDIPQDQKSLLAALWTAPQAPAVEIQKLRSRINTGKEFAAFEIFSSVSLPVVVSTFKEFFLELPDSIVSSTVYDIIKATYAKTNQSTPADLDEQAAKEDQRLKLNLRIERLVGLLSHLSQVNIDSIQTLVTHFAEICGLPEKETSDSSSYDVPESVADISRAISSYILRPRSTTALSMTDKHPVLFLQDLIMHRAKILEEVQRRLNLAQEARTRSRSASSSEANRRFQIEARNREIAAATILAASSSLSSNGGPSRSSSGLDLNKTRGGRSGSYNESSNTTTRPLSLSPNPPSAGSGSTMRPLTLSPLVRRKSGSLPKNAKSNLLSVSDTDKSHRRSFSSTTRPPLSMFLSPEPVRRAE